MEEHTGVTPPAPPPERPPTSSWSPQRVQEMEGPPDNPVLSLRKDLAGHLTAFKSKSTLPASGRTSMDQQDLLMAISAAPIALAQEAALTVAQELGKAQPSGPGWPTDPAKQANAWISGG